jgi:hypothetical protein
MAAYRSEMHAEVARPAEKQDRFLATASLGENAEILLPPVAC